MDEYENGYERGYDMGVGFGQDEGYKGGIQRAASLVFDLAQKFIDLKTKAEFDVLVKAHRAIVAELSK
jgi:hypothetical protein